MLISLGAYSTPENMGSVTIRTGQTSQGLLGLSPWNESHATYSVSMINLGNNPISKIEIVSALNSINIAHDLYVYFNGLSFIKYNPKVYLGAVQSVSGAWTLDTNSSAQNAKKVAVKLFLLFFYYAIFSH